LFLLEYIKKNEKLLDLGCGNGRLYKRIQSLGVDYTGIDLSENLIKKAEELYPQAKFYVASALDLSFPDSTFDKIISIAVLHHIPSYKLRIKFMEEVHRVLKKDGQLILTV
jgi:ubiquinone/menaquinone biosynthesis C-methylase UbiE